MQQKLTLRKVGGFGMGTSYGSVLMIEYFDIATTNFWINVRCLHECNASLAFFAEQIIAGNINKPIWNTYYEFCPFCHVRNKRQTIRSAYFSVNTAIIEQSKYVVVVDKTTGLQC